MAIDLTNPNSIVRNKDLLEFKEYMEQSIPGSTVASTATCEACIDELL